MSMFGAMTGAICHRPSRSDVSGAIGGSVANSRTSTIAQVPCDEFGVPLGGQSYPPVNSYGSGSLVVSLAEGSTVEIATGVARLIIGPQACSVDDLLNSTIILQR